MAWVNWSRRATAASGAAVGGSLGIEINASRARAALGASSRNRLHSLDHPHTDLPLAISLDRRVPEIGRAGIALLRRLPHAVCDGFLPHLGQPQEWKAGRHRLDAAGALGVAFAKLRLATIDHNGVFVGLPSYLTHAQVAKLTIVANNHRFPLRGTVSGALALAADRAASLLSHPFTELEHRVEGIVPLYRLDKTSLPADALVIDADEYALTVNLIRIEPTQVQLLQTATLPRGGVKQWKERLLDSLADRCIQVCRRDPRDSAEAEQSLYEQIDASLDGVRVGQSITLTLRTDHWYQDLHLQPEEFGTICSGLIRSCVDCVRDLLDDASAAGPPRAVWMTHEAGRLPGLAQALHQNVAEKTSVGVLRPEAVAIAVANLGERWPAGGHLDSMIPVAVKSIERKSTHVKASIEA